MLKHIFCIYCGQKSSASDTKCPACKRDLEEVIGLAALLEDSTLIYREAVEKNGQIKIRETWTAHAQQQEEMQYSGRDFSTTKFSILMIVILGLIWFLVPIIQDNDSDVSQKTVSNSQNAASNKVLKAKALLESNLQRQDSCFSTRTFNGDSPDYARNLCIARFPTSIEWALSKNHAREQSCYNARVFNGDNEINARNICLARYPIR